MYLYSLKIKFSSNLKLSQFSGKIAPNSGIINHFNPALRTGLIIFDSAGVMSKKMNVFYQKAGSNYSAVSKRSLVEVSSLYISISMLEKN